MLLPGWVCESTGRLNRLRRDGNAGTNPSLPLLTGTLSLQTLLAIYARDVPADQNDIILSTGLGAEAILATQGG